MEGTNKIDGICIPLSKRSYEVKEQSMSKCPHLCGGGDVNIILNLNLKLILEYKLCLTLCSNSIKIRWLVCTIFLGYTKSV
jgi:hypothetical protein